MVQGFPSHAPRCFLSDCLAECYHTQGKVQKGRPWCNARYGDGTQAREKNPLEQSLSTKQITRSISTNGRGVVSYISFLLYRLGEHVLNAILEQEGGVTKEGCVT